MDPRQLLDTLQEEPLYELFRLASAIYVELDNPDRIEKVRRRLRPGMEIRFYDSQENRMIDAIVVQLDRTHLLVRIVNGQLTHIHFGSVDLEGSGAPQPISTPKQQVSRATLKVGDMVGFHDRQNIEHFARVERLNQKSATVIATDGRQWRVAYALLFRVIEPGRKGG